MIIKSRADWGARPPLSPPSKWSDGPHDLVVHWVGGSGTMGLTSPDKVPAAIRNIQAYEQSKGYSDIAYNLIDVEGEVSADTLADIRAIEHVIKAWTI